MNQIAAIDALAQQDPEGMGPGAHAWREGLEQWVLPREGEHKVES